MIVVDRDVIDLPEQAFVNLLYVIAWERPGLRAGRRCRENRHERNRGHSNRFVHLHPCELFPETRYRCETAARQCSETRRMRSSASWSKFRALTSENRR